MSNETIITINRKFSRPSAELLKPFSEIPTGYVVDVQDRRGALDCSIKPMFDFPSIDCLQAIFTDKAENIAESAWNWQPAGRSVYNPALRAPVALQQVTQQTTEETQP